MAERCVTKTDHRMAHP